MKKWQVIAPLGLAAAGAIAAGILTLTKKDDEPAENAAQTKEKKASGKNLAEGIYSFVAGYKDATTEEVSVKYDKDCFSFAVVEDEFLSYSSDSHVAVMYGEDFNIQIEYADFYSGEDFNKLKDTISNKFKGFEDVVINSVSAYRYVDGDSVCYCLPAGASYVLVTVIPSKESKETVLTLPDNSELKSILNSITITSK